eukprot:403358301
MMIPEDLNEFFNEKSTKENKGKTGQGILQLKQAQKIENKQTQSSQDNLQVNHKNPIATTSNQNEKNLVNLADKQTFGINEIVMQKLNDTLDLKELYPVLNFKRFFAFSVIHILQSIFGPLVTVVYDLGYVCHNYFCSYLNGTQVLLFLRAMVLWMLIDCNKCQWLSFFKHEVRSQGFVCQTCY